MKKSFFFSLVLLVSINLSGKTFPGYIINNQGDTLHGHIHVKSDLRLFSEIGFSSTNKKAPEQLFHPGDIKGFSFLGTDFISANVPVEEPILLKEGGGYYPPKVQTIDVFLTVDVRGTASLFFFKNDMRQEHYYVKMADSDFLELLAYQYFQEQENVSGNETKKLKVTDRKFENLLLQIFQECPDIDSKVKDTQLRREELIKLFTFYNQCRGSEEVKINPNGKDASIRWSVGLGASLTQIRFTSPPDYFQNAHLTQSDFQFRPQLALGVDLDIPLSNYNPKWFLQAAFLWDRLELRAEYKEGIEPFLSQGNFNLNQVQVNISRLNIPIELSHQFLLGNASLRIGAGVMPALMNLRNNDLIVQKYVDNKEIFSPQTRPALASFDAVGIAALGSLSVSYNRWRVKSYVSFGSEFLEPEDELDSNSVFVGLMLYFKLTK